MEYKKVSLNGYNLHLIKTDKFKTILMKFVFLDEIKKEEITIKNFLFNMLFFSSKKYNSKRLMNIQRQNLYELSIFGSNRRLGKYTKQELSFNMLNPKYTEKSMYEESISFIKEILFNPNVKDNAFDSTSFDIIKNDLKRDILSLEEYPKEYSFFRLKNVMDSNNPFSFNIDGYVDDLEKITSESLFEYYKKVFDNSTIDIYIVGDISFTYMEDLVRKNFNFNKSNRIKILPENKYLPTRKSIYEVKEKSKFKQTQVQMGLSIKNMTEKEKKYVAVIYNNILGNSPSSKLFKNIREKKSFVYNISSSYYKHDEVIFITFGTLIDNVSSAISAVKSELKEMKKGHFSDNDISSSKEFVCNSLKEFDEYQSSIAEYFFAIDYLGIDNIDISIKNINSVSKDDIKSFAKKVIIDTIYVLEEDR